MPAVESSRPRASRDPSTARFAARLFIIAEVMFFAALVAVYIVLKFTAKVWRPAGFPALATGLPLANTVVLVASGAFLGLGSRAIRREDPWGLAAYVALALATGAAFVAVQVLEFRRLMAAELPLAGNVFGGVFYAMAGLHALHVAGGLLLLAYVLVQAIRGRFHQYRRAALDLACYYWALVVGVWIFFFLILYLF
jgi:cytochrome c oxidase subunit 3